MKTQETSEECKASERIMEKKFFNAGYYPDLSNEDYHGSSGFSSSTIKMIIGNTMSHMNYALNNPKPASDSMNTGTLVHALLLEPEKFFDEFIIMPEGLSKPSSSILNAKKPSAESLIKIAKWEDWLKISEGKTSISQEQFDIADKMVSKITEHPVMRNWFDSSLDLMPEQSIYYWYKPDIQIDDDKPVMCKVRPDLVIKGHHVIFDVKTCKNAGFTNFMKDCYKYKYHLSAAMYLQGVNSCKDFLKACEVISFTKFVWIVVENNPPHEATFYEASKDDLYTGLQLYHNCMRKISLYNKSEWKGYGDVGDDGLINPEGRVSEIPNYGYEIA